ncbi:MAG: hypothetical protein ABF497_12910 [Sporolactobacillus sp.]
MTPTQVGRLADLLQDRQEVTDCLYTRFQAFREAKLPNVPYPFVLQHDQITEIRQVLEKELVGMADFAWDLYRKKGTNEMSLAAFTLLADWQGLWNELQRAEVAARTRGEEDNP